MKNWQFRLSDAWQKVYYLQEVNSFIPIEIKSNRYHFQWWKSCFQFKSNHYCHQIRIKQSEVTLHMIKPYLALCDSVGFLLLSKINEYDNNPLSKFCGDVNIGVRSVTIWPSAPTCCLTVVVTFVTKSSVDVTSSAVTVTTSGFFRKFLSNFHQNFINLCKRIVLPY